MAGRARKRRIAVPAAALLVVLVVPVATSSARESPAEKGQIRNGTAKAVALVSRIGPGVGDLELAMRGGLAITQVTNDLAQATSQTLDMGLIGSSLTAENCRGDQPIKPDQLPQPTSVDNRSGDTAADRDESGTDGAMVGLGRMHVSAKEQPVFARAVTTTTGLHLAPALQIASGRAISETKVLRGDGRQALAEVTSTIDFGGVVSMEGMRWRAFHRTGRDPHAAGLFELGRAAIGGVPFPAGDTERFEDAANQALEPLGVTLRLPRVERHVEPNDLVRVTALRISIEDSPAGRAAFGPLFDATRAGRSDLFEALSEAMCETAGVLLVGDVVLSVVAGTGFLRIDVGGAEASSSDFEMKDPFGDAIVPPPVGDLPIVTGDGTGAEPSTGVVSTPPVSRSPTHGSTEEALPAAARSGPLDRMCESVHPNGDSCSRGAAATLGLLALLSTFGVAGADVVRRRRVRPGGDT